MFISKLNKYLNLKNTILFLIFLWTKNYINNLRREVGNDLRKSKPFLLDYRNTEQKKLFCILEQGSEINTNMAFQNKKNFTTDFSDFYRLNWKNNKEDLNANFFADKICFSEGRSVLYEKTKGKYDYYIFIDDDVVINSKLNEAPAITIKNQLLENQPIHASIPNDCWPNLIGKKSQDVFNMKGGDVCVQIFRSDFAEIMLPTWFHGAHGAMWYAQFIAHILFPNKSIYLNKLEAYNTRHEEQSYMSFKSFNDRFKVKKLFINILKNIKLKVLFKIWKIYSSNNLNLDYNEYSLGKDYTLNKAILKYIIK
tara:strand:+ start:362 stop:1291 length:930 start_codon:yes stop_codon:yes gene_type:complete